MLVLGTVATAIVIAGLAGTGTPAAAVDGRDDDSRISVTAPVLVRAGERVDGPVGTVDGGVRVDGEVDGPVFVVHGNARITGRVTGSVLVVDGDAFVDGRVDDNVIVVSGRASIGSGAVVGGDVRSSEQPRVAQGARVEGDVDKTDFAAWFSLAGWIALFLWWVAVTITLLVVGVVLILLFPRAAGVVSATGRGSFWLCVGWGAILGLALPIVVGVLFASVVGLPLGFMVLLALALAFPLGYVATSLVLGRLIARRAHDVVAFLVGFAILRVVALVPGLGWLVGFLAAALGVGVLAVTAWRAGRRAPAEDATAEPVPA
jgi:cytoskeletal protein CcmA (bactofilin family)